MEPPAPQNRKPLFSFGMVGLIAMISALCVAMAVNFRMGNPHYIGGPIVFVATWVLVFLSYRVAVRLFDRWKRRTQPMEMDDDREPWDSIWRARIKRRLPDGCKLDAARDFPPETEITIAADPPEYAAQMFVNCEICPVCGQMTAANNRIKASVSFKGYCLLGAWAHSDCLEQCPAIGRANSSPW